MSEIKRRFWTWIPFSIIAGISIYYARSEGMATINGKTMGTSYSVKLVYRGTKPDVSIIKLQLDELLRDFNQSLSTYIPDSEISKFNKSKVTEWFKVDSDFISTINIARDIHDKTNVFDPTIGPIINLWGFGEDGIWNNPPKKEKLESLRNEVGFDKLILDKKISSIRKTNPKIKINLSAIAKGYGVDVVYRYLENIGSQNFMVEIGGEIRTKGQKMNNKPWKVGIESPDIAGSSLQKIIKLNDMGMATSGNYRNYFEKDGVRYSHIIDPQTLSPVTHKLASVTVTAENCVLADGWATALLVLGPSEGLKVADKFGISAFFIVSNDQGYANFSSAKFKNNFSKL